MSQLTDKPLVQIAKCATCGKAKNQHQATTLRCPLGRRATSGYAAYATTTFRQAK